MSRIKHQIEYDYNGSYDDQELHGALEHFDSLGIEFDLYDDDQFWLTNDMKETGK